MSEELNINPVEGPPGGSPEENQSKSPADVTASKNKELEENLRKAEEEKENYKRAFFLEKEKTRELELSKQKPSYESQPMSYSEDDFEVRYHQVREKEKTEEREKALKIAFERFKAKYPFYRPENDLNDMNYNRLKKATDKMYLGDTIDEIMDSLDFAHRGLQFVPNSNPKPESLVEDSGIGGTTTVLQGKTDLESALTRPLNTYEQQMVQMYNGGEKEYRKAPHNVDDL